MISLPISKEWAESTMQAFLKEKKSRASAIHPAYERLYAEIERVSFAGGKRLRPHLLFIGYGSHDATAATLAAAHEFLHLALLAHDDIIDRDDTRHDQQTIHRRYEDIYQSYNLIETDLKHFSTSSALLAGDLLISSAYELINSAPLSLEQYKKANNLLSKSIFEVAAGELLDTEAAFVSEVYNPLIIYHYKTACYSFIAPLLTGAHLSPKKHSEHTLRHLEHYATNIGIAYQIQDDRLGVFGDASVTGKSTVNDLREGKQTLLINIFEQLASAEQKAHFDTCFGVSAASEQSLNELKDHILASGALEKTLTIEQEYIDAAREALSHITDEQLHSDLTTLTQLLIGRSA